MRKASPGPMSFPNASITAPVHAANAPICSGSTTCCAMTSPLAFISAQEASCDSRTMVEKPVRNSEFCISCTMPERLALTTSSSMGSMGMVVAALRHDQVLPLVHARDLAAADHGGAVELLEDRGSRNAQAHVEPLARIDRAIDFAAGKPRPSRAAPRICEAAPGRLEFSHLDLRHEADAAHAVGDNFDLLLRRHVAEHGLVLRVECRAQLRQAARRQRLRRAGERDLVALPGVANVERALDADAIGTKSVVSKLDVCLSCEPVKHLVHLGRNGVGKRSEFRAHV